MKWTEHVRDVHQVYAFPGGQLRFLERPFAELSHFSSSSELDQILRPILECFR